MENSKETSEKIQEIQMMEQQLQGFLAQKQTFQLDLNETLNALNELSNTNDEVYKVLSGIMIKSDKDKIIKDLQEKKKLHELRISSIEKQEKILEDKANQIKNELSAFIKEKEAKK